MSQKILQINFKLNMPPAEYEQAVAPLAGAIAETPALAWKVWLINAAQHEAGGLYLFDDEASLQAYVNGPIVDGVKKHPGLSDITAKVFDVIERVSLITRAPIRESVAA
jgi:hypothetical protein